MNAEDDPKDKAAEPASSPEKKEAPKELSKEEQMAAYEEELKNEDWGHQPC